jgi:hypothetical protein
MTTEPPPAPQPSASARWAEIKAVFDAAIELQPAQRQPLIQAAALSPQALAELQSLLQHHDAAAAGDGAAAGGFLAGRPAHALVGAAARIGQRLGAWEVVRELGAGGMGEVFEARRADGQYEGRAAVKLLKRGMDSAAVLARFAQERQALARLNHPHIARLLDAGASHDGLPYVVMDFVDGRPLDEAARALPVAGRLQLFLQLADAVAHAHRNLLVHRDLKPGNVLVDAEGSVKLLDFGIAKALDPLEAAGPDGLATTQGGERPFTPNYASPEQVRGQPVTTATDIYSLGVLLYQLLTGTRPTGRSATTPDAVARSVLEETPTRPSRLTPREALDPQWLQTRKTLEGDLDNILLKALEKEPERRYASVDALASDVRAFIDGRPVSARPASAGYVAAKFVRRHRLPAALAAAAVLALVAGLGGTAWQWQQAERARAAEAQRAAQVRMQANRLLFDYHDAILLLPGATPVVKKLLEDARGYLDSLAASATASAGSTAADAPLLRELGVAQRRLGELYSSPGRPALGDSRAALALLQQSVALLERAHAAQPRDASGRYQLALSQATLAELLREQGNPPAALPLLEQSAASFDALATQAPQNVSYRVEQLRGPLRLADLFGSTSGGLGQGARADAQLERAGALLGALRRDFPDDLDVAALVSSTQNMRYLAASREGRWAEGLAFLEANRPIFAQLLQRAPDNALFARDAAINSLSRGTALGQLGRFAEARDASREGLARMQALVAADPANRGGRRDAAKLQTDVGWASLQLGDLPDALQQLGAAVQSLQALAAADTADRRVAGLLVLAQATLAEAHAAAAMAAPGSAAATPHAGGARRQAAAAVAGAQRLVDSAAADLGARRTLALAQLQAGQALAALGRLGGPASAADAKAACAQLRASQAAWQLLQSQGRLRKADAPRADKAAQGAAACSG